MIKYPNITVTLSDGNAFAILGTVQRALKNAGAPAADVQAFIAEATAGDYDALLQTVTRWVEVDI
jgi:hypothetical protein